MGCKKTSSSFAAVAFLPFVMACSTALKQPLFDIDLYNLTNLDPFSLSVNNNISSQDISEMTGISEDFIQAFEDYLYIGHKLDRDYITKIDWADIAIDLAQHHNSQFDVDDNYLETVRNTLSSLPEDGEYNPLFASAIIYISHQAYLSQPLDSTTGTREFDANSFAKIATERLFENLDRHSKYTPVSADAKTQTSSSSSSKDDSEPESLVQTYMIEGDIAYIKLSAFRDQSSEMIEHAINELRSNDPQAYILDLRDNRGGYVSDASEIADMFLEDGLIYKSVRQRGERVVRAEDGDLTEGAPLAVLVNENSASASELVVAALKENDRATIFGQTTFGKGTSVLTYDLDDGSKFSFTNSYLFGPENYSVQNIGLNPDVIISNEFNMVASWTAPSRRQSKLENPLNLTAYPERPSQRCTSNIRDEQVDNTNPQDNEAPEQEQVQDITLQCAVDYLKGKDTTTRLARILYEDQNQIANTLHEDNIQISMNRMSPR